MNFCCVLGPTLTHGHHILSAWWYFMNQLKGGFVSVWSCYFYLPFGLCVGPSLKHQPYLNLLLPSPTYSLFTSDSWFIKTPTGKGWGDIVTLRADYGILLLERGIYILLRNIHTHTYISYTEIYIHRIHTHIHMYISVNGHVCLWRWGHGQ